MNIQSLSIVVPGKCPNKCPFCVVNMHEEEYVNQVEQNIAFRDLYERDFIDRLSFARDNGCNTVMLTGNGEPLVNRNYLDFFATCNEHLEHPFRWVELQTSGILLDDKYLRHLRNKVRVSTISLSIINIFDEVNNYITMNMPLALRTETKKLCAEIKKYDFNLRLSINLTNIYDDIQPKKIFDQLKKLKVDQVTFRKLYAKGDTKEAQWVKENACAYTNQKNTIYTIKDYIKINGKPLEKLPFGAIRYSVHGISTVLDDDCMSTDPNKETMKYLILRPNCKLYTKWDDEGSLLF
jgi:molybdenum cofactor biosynthesis enzyme MoaA